MICWIATYPGCGSTLLSQIIQALFNSPVYFDEQGFEGFLDKSTLSLINLKSLENPFSSYYEEFKSSKSWYFVKTHQLPIDDSPAIVVTRDGRAACTSYWHFQKQYFPDYPSSLLEIILGNIRYTHWSAFYKGWNPLEREQTLFLKYEDIKSHPALELEKISYFLNLKPQGNWVDNFQSYHSQNPAIFRSGKVTNPSNGYTLDELRVFWWSHAEWMEKMGYDKSEEDNNICNTPFDAPKDIFKIISQLVSNLRLQNDNYLDICNDRLKVIHQLHNEAENRLQIINKMKLYI